MAYWDLTGALPKGPVSPGAQLDWPVDFTAWLAGAAVQTITWTMPAGLTLDQQTLAGGVATAWMSGFAAGKSYEVAVEVLTNSSPARRDKRYFTLRCAKR